jgi:hypothetical protein
MYVCMYVDMYVCIRVGHKAGPCTATFNSEGLLFSHFYLQSPRNPLIKGYTEIYYMIDEEDNQSIQCKMNLQQSFCYCVCVFVSA